MSHVFAPALAACLISLSAFADTLHVPADYATIQGAIDAAGVKDRILVAPGTYVESIDFLGKDIIVRSTNGASFTTIQGTSGTPVVQFVSGEPPSATLTGFTIMNGSPGVVCSTGSSPTITYNTVTANVSDGSGAGFVCGANSNPLIAYNRITDNVSTIPLAHGGGGGIWLSASSPTILSNWILGNAAAEVGGGIYCYFGSSPIIANNVIIGNQAKRGGGIACRVDSLPTITNNTIYSNQASSEGGGLFVEISAAPTVVNDILWANTPDEITGAFSVTYCDVEGGFPGVGNISANPLMLDPAGLDIDVQLAGNSPCRDVGNISAPGLPALDYHGDPRVMGIAPDIGVDEYLLGPIPQSVSPASTRYDQPVEVTINGQGFSTGSAMVWFGSQQIQDVEVVSDIIIKCLVPVGMPGPVDVKVETTLSFYTLVDGFTYTPSVGVEPATAPPGGSVSLAYLFDPGDWVLGTWGLPPVYSVPTPPYAGALAIWPLHKLFMVPSWPFDSLSQVIDVPDEPSLSGLQVLFQGLVGPSLVIPVDAAWTNCAVFTIQ